MEMPLYDKKCTAGLGQAASRQSRLSAMQEGIEIIFKQLIELENLADNLIGMQPPAVAGNKEKLEENTLAVMVSSFPVVARSLAERIGSVEARLRDAFM